MIREGGPAWEGWELRADYHTHTRYSHGKGTVEDNVRAARERGLVEVGICDHGPGLMFIGLRGEAALARMRREADRAQARFPQVRVRLGVEANVITPAGDLDVSPEVISWLDLLLVGLHPQLRPSLWKGAGPLMWNHLWGRFSREGAARARAVNTRALIEAVSRYRVTAVTHAGFKMDVDMAQLAPVCARRGTAIEVNSLHGYPAVAQLREAARHGVRFLLSSDAHRPDQVGELAAGLVRLGAAGIGPEQVLNAARSLA